jgi:phage shock protein PspC (stress-responsive transcriptional regulator)
MPKAPIKKLSRSSSDRVLVGVCGGLAEYFQIDVTVVRLTFVILTILGGSGFLIYLIMALVIPLDTPSANTKPIESLSKRKKLFGLLGIGLGLILLTNNLMPELWLLVNHSLLVPALIITLGCILLLKKSH